MEGQHQKPVTHVKELYIQDSPSNSRLTKYLEDRKVQKVLVEKKVQELLADREVQEVLVQIQRGPVDWQVMQKFKRFRKLKRSRLIGEWQVSWMKT